MLEGPRKTKRSPLAVSITRGGEIRNGRPRLSPSERDSSAWATRPRGRWWRRMAHRENQAAFTVV